MVEYITWAVDIPAILQLPWIVKGPGLLLIVIFLFRSITLFLTLHPIRAITNIVYAFVIALILSRFGVAIGDWIASQQFAQ